VWYEDNAVMSTQGTMWYDQSTKRSVWSTQCDDHGVC